jgi:hypothetical protein
MRKAMVANFRKQVNQRTFVVDPLPFQPGEVNIVTDFSDSKINKDRKGNGKYQHYAE